MIHNIRRLSEIGDRSVGHHYRHIDMAERSQIMKLLERKVPLSQVAKIVGRHLSTLYREFVATITEASSRCFPYGFPGMQQRSRESGGSNDVSWNAIVSSGLRR